MKRRDFMVIAGLLTLALPGCALADDTPDYRYRLTVEVDTPDGVRSGSSVIEVEQRLVRPGSNPAGMAVERRVRGQAVAVDLSGGRTLFALLRSEDNVDWASYVFVMLAPPSPGEGFAEQIDNVQQVQGEQALPRMWPPVAPGLQQSGYPMLVTFADPTDPTSVARVDPDDLAATFGDGVTLRRITVQLTDDPVTTGIEERLGWLGEHPEPRLDPDYRGSTNPNLSQRLWHGDFRKGNDQ